MLISLSPESAVRKDCLEIIVSASLSEQKLEAEDNGTDSEEMTQRSKHSREEWRLKTERRGNCTKYITNSPTCVIRKYLSRNSNTIQKRGNLQKRTPPVT